MSYKVLHMKSTKVDAQHIFQRTNINVLILSLLTPLSIASAADNIFGTDGQIRLDGGAHVYDSIYGYKLTNPTEVISGANVMIKGSSLTFDNFVTGAFVEADQNIGKLTIQNINVSLNGSANEKLQVKLNGQGGQDVQEGIQSISGVVVNRYSATKDIDISNVHFTMNHVEVDSNAKRITSIGAIGLGSSSAKYNLIAVHDNQMTVQSSQILNTNTLRFFWPGQSGLEGTFRITNNSMSIFDSRVDAEVKGISARVNSGSMAGITVQNNRLTIENSALTKLVDWIHCDGVSFYKKAVIKNNELIFSNSSLLAGASALNGLSLIHMTTQEPDTETVVQENVFVIKGNGERSKLEAKNHRFISITTNDGVLNMQKNQFAISDSEIKGTVFANTAILNTSIKEDTTIQESKFTIDNTSFDGNVYLDYIYAYGNASDSTNRIDGTQVEINKASFNNSNLKVAYIYVDGNITQSQNTISNSSIKLNDFSFTGKTSNVVNVIGNSISTTNPGVSSIVETDVQFLGNTNIQEGNVAIVTAAVQGDLTISGEHVLVGDNAKISDNMFLTFLTVTDPVTLKDLTVEVMDQADLSSLNLYGYYNTALDGNLADTSKVRNITFLVNGWQGSRQGKTKVKSLNNFTDITFKNIAWQKDGSALEITDGVAGALANTSINVEGNVIVGNTVPQKDESMYLIRIGNAADLGLKDRNIKQKEVAFEHQDGLVQGTANVSLDEKGQVLLTVGSTQPTEQTGLLNDQRVIASALVSRTNDMIPYALDAVKVDAQKGIQTFALWENAALRFDVAESVKLNHWTGLFGVGHTVQNQHGQWADALFFEMGDGNYRTRQVKNDQEVRGDGAIRHYGLGYAFEQRMPNHWYVDGGVRVGYLYTEMEDALVNAHGRSLRLKTSAPYAAADVGVGYINAYKWGNVDVYGKLLYTWNGSDRSVIGQTEVRARSIDSLRSQLGVRVSTHLNTQWSSFMGLAWEYEYSGDSTMRVSGIRVPRESLEGSTGIGEVGLRWASARTPLSIECRARGYVGQQKGASGLLRATYSF